MRLSRLVIGISATIATTIPRNFWKLSGCFSIFIAPQMWYTIRTHVKPKEKKKKKVKKEKLDELTIPGIND